MDSTRVREICTHRLGLWTDDLVRDHATPAVLVGIGHDHKAGTLSICMVEDIDKDKLIVFLTSALEKLLDSR